MDPRDKRLAMEVDDHPLSWGDLEGAIPKDSRLEGETLRGGRSPRRVEGRRRLLVRRRDDDADAGDPVAERPEPAASGRTIEELAR